MATACASGNDTAWMQQYPENMKVKQAKKRKETKPHTATNANTGTKIWNTRADKQYIRAQNNARGYKHLFT